MKLHDADTISRVRGAEMSAKFGIALTGKSVKALVQTLYPDPIKAVIRELSTNAVDAHQAAGTLDKKYIVKLPTITDPQFSIRDFGTGMSKMKIMPDHEPLRMQHGDHTLTKKPRDG